ASIPLDKNNYYIIFYNMLNWDFSGVENVTLDFLKDENVENFRLEDESGNDIPFILLEKNDTKKFVSEINVLPDWIEIRRFKINLVIENIKGLSYKSIKIITNVADFKPVNHDFVSI